MTAPDFRAALARLGMSQRAFARYVRANERTVRRWAEGAQDIPGWVPVMLALMEAVRSARSELIEVSFS